MNFSVVMPEIKTAGQVLVKKLGPNMKKVMGTVGTNDIKGLKFDDLVKAVKDIPGAEVSELANGTKVVKLKTCCYINSTNTPQNVVVTFSKEGDCLMLSGAGTRGAQTTGFSLRTPEGVDKLLDAGVKNPGERVSNVIIRDNKGRVTDRWFAENSGTPAQDVIAQPYEYPHLGNALKHTCYNQ